MDHPEKPERSSRIIAFESDFVDRVMPVIERIEREREESLALDGLKKVTAKTIGEQMPEDLSGPEAEA